MDIKVSEATIHALAGIITGDLKQENEPISIYRTGRQLVSFFKDFCATSGLDNLSRNNYVLNMLRELNDSKKMKNIIEETLDPIHFTDKLTNKSAVSYLTPYLEKDRLALKKSTQRQGVFLVTTPDSIDLNQEKLSYINHDFVQEQIEKCREKISDGDYDGAITNARSLMEQIQEFIIENSKVNVDRYDGDLQKLYKQTKKILKLNIDGNMSKQFKQLLSGLNSIVTAISGISNDMGDRHARSYQPNKHHAKLTVSASFMFCEFLLDIDEYQQNKL